MSASLRVDGQRPQRGVGAPSRPDLMRVSALSLRNRCARALWTFVYLMFFRASPRPFHLWRRCLLRLFGARLGKCVLVYASARIWAPWNLTMADHSCLGPNVDCYCVEQIEIGRYASVSQYSYLCTAGHDVDSHNLSLIAARIVIADFAWVAADVFVGPGVQIGEGAVVGARSSVFKDVAPWSVVAGCPARLLRMRSRSVQDGRIDARSSSL